jgi:hypothetical protein
MIGRITYPVGRNGVVEVGIAAGADDLPSPELILKIAVKVSTSGAPIAAGAAAKPAIMTFQAETLSDLGLEEKLAEDATYEDFEPLLNAACGSAFDELKDATGNMSASAVLGYATTLPADGFLGEACNALKTQLKAGKDARQTKNHIGNLVSAFAASTLKGFFSQGKNLPACWREAIAANVGGVAANISARLASTGGPSSGSSAPAGPDPDVVPTDARHAHTLGLELDLDCTLFANRKPYSETEHVRLWNSLVAWVASNGYFAPGADSVRVMSLAESRTLVSDAQYVTECDKINTVGFCKWDKVATLVFATKVSWWLTNHHVGQKKGEIKSFTGKVFRALEFQVEEAEARTTIWASGKWCSTTGILRSAGIKGLIRPVKDVPWNPINMGHSEDISMRIASYPAGVAKTTTYAQIYSHAARSAYGVLVPAVVNIKDVRDDMVRIKADPARYHMGSQFLTGKARLEAEHFSESDMENLSGYIHAVAPTSKLAQASVICGKEEVAGNTVFTTIMSVKAQLAAVAGMKASMALVSRMAGGDIRGGIALAEGKITAEEVAKAIKQSEEEEKKSEEKPAGSAVKVALASS